MGAPQAISAADVFQPVTPVRLKERRRPNWTAAMALALVIIAGVFAYQHFASHSATAAKQDARVQNPSTAPKPKAKTSPAVVAHQHGPRKLDIKLTATQDCWVLLTSPTGADALQRDGVRGQVDELDREAPGDDDPRQSGRGEGEGERQEPDAAGTVSMVTLSLHAGRVH